MHSISVEILLQVFKYLPYEQKLQCKLVCTEWANILRSGFDLETIMIPYISNFPTLRITREFVHKVQNDTVNLGTKCKRLTLCRHHDRAKLASLFPNLKYLCFLPTLEDDDNSTNLENSSHNDISQMHHLENWHYNLKTFIELRFDHELFTFLKTGVFHQLTTIILHSYWRETIGKYRILFNVLENTPMLKMLYLTGGTIEIYDFEYLHTNVPGLRSLLLQNVRIISEKEMNIKPAKIMTRFELITCSVNQRSVPGIAQYIGSKYPNLQQFAFTTSYYEQLQIVEGDNIIAENPWKNLFTSLLDSTGNFLKSFKIKIPVELPQIFTELREKARSLEIFEVNLFHKKEYIEKSLDIVRSNYNIYSLILDEVPPLDFKVFQDLCTLKELELRFEFNSSNAKYPIEISTFINCLPKSVEKISLFRVGLYLDSRKEDFFGDSGIKYIKIAHSTAINDLSSYLSNHFPKLDTLIIHRCYLDFDIKLPNHRLKFVHIFLVGISVYMDETNVEEGISKPKCFTKHLRLTVGNVTHQYIKNDPVIFYTSTFSKDIFDVHDHSMYYVCKPIVLNEEHPYFYFQCASVQTLLYNGYLILI